MFGAARNLTKEMWNFRYTGHVIMDDDSESRNDRVLSEHPVVCDVKTRFSLFGGCAYLIHAKKDNSRFSHVLPGLHDVDVKSWAKGFPRGGEIILQPFSRRAIDHLTDTNSDNILEEEGLLPSILKKISSNVRDSLNQSRSPKYYYRHTNGNRHLPSDQVGGKNATIMVPPRNNVLYQEIINEIFLLVIVDEDSMFKVQVEVSGQLGNVIAVDHVLELVFVVEDDPTGSECGEMEKIDGLFLPSKRELYIQNMKSGIERSFDGISNYMSKAHQYHVFGKCARDVLRLTYIILTDLDADKSWVNTPIIDTSVRNLPREYKLKLTEDRNLYTNHRQTPIEYFTQYMKHIAPCIERSNVGGFNLGGEKSINWSKHTHTWIGSFGRDFHHIPKFHKANQGCRSQYIFNEC